MTSLPNSTVAMVIVATVAVSMLVMLDVVECRTSGCAAAKLCCRQKDNSCRVTGQRMNRKSNSSSSSRSTCFCDAGCLQTGDCCTDYRQYCAVVDCELSDVWSDWGECSVLCGLGVKERRRPIVRHAVNGGRACPVADQVQRVVCEGITCKVPRALSPATLQLYREIGRIIPLSFARWRQSNTYNPYKGAHPHDNSVPAGTPTWCANYELTSARAPCSRSPVSWATPLKTGYEMCVECQPSTDEGSSSCRGRGVFNRETRWSAMTASGCHGTWIMRTRWRQCTCGVGTNEPPAYVFV